MRFVLIQSFLEYKERTDGLRSMQRLNVESVAAPMRELRGSGSHGLEGLDAFDEHHEILHVHGERAVARLHPLDDPAHPGDELGKLTELFVRHMPEAGNSVRVLMRPVQLDQVDLGGHELLPPSGQVTSRDGGRVQHPLRELVGPPLAGVACGPPHGLEPRQLEDQALRIVLAVILRVVVTQLEDHLALPIEEGLVALRLERLLLIEETLGLPLGVLELRLRVLELGLGALELHREALDAADHVVDHDQADDDDQNEAADDGLGFHYTLLRDAPDE